MSYVDVVTEATSRFAAGFFVDYPLAPVFFENNLLVDASGNPLDEETGKPTPDPADPFNTFYVRQTLIPAVTATLTLGGTDWTIGRGMYDIFVPLHCGPTVGPQIAEDIRGYFRLKAASGVSFIAADGVGPSWRPIGPTDSGRYQYQVDVPWQHVEYGSGPAEEDVVSNQLLVTQATHGFAVKDAIAFDTGTEAWEQVIATDAGMTDIKAAAGALAGIVTQVIDANTFRVVVSGAATMPAHGFALGQQYVSTTVAGGMQTSAPGAGAWNWLLVMVPDVNHIVVLDTEPQRL
jgi:hypothetical protein